MDNSEARLLKIPEAAHIAAISLAQAYRLVPEWRKLGMVVDVGPRAVRVNKHLFLQWCKEGTAIVSKSA